MTAPVFGPAEIPRDNWGRPLVLLPDRSQRVAYTRCTTYVGPLEDQFALGKWQQRKVAEGLATRPDLLLWVNSLGPEPPHREADALARWKQAMDTACEDAIEAARAHAAATIGSALHKLTERIDRGEDVGRVPEQYRPHMVAYAEATAHLHPVHIEQFSVLDELKIGGTPDRVVTIDGEGDELFIADIKGLALATPIPTPDGWTTMAAVQVGDQVFGSDGRPCTVTVKSAVKRIGTYVVRFDDGSQIVCDSEHLWWTTSGRWMGTPTVKSVREVRRTLHRYGQAHHRVPVTAPLALPEAELPIDPYLLGCWLGDGAVRGGAISKGADLFEVLATDGHPLGKEQIDSRSGVITRTVLGLTTQLGTAGLLHHKHVPTAYLRASIPQRLRLLQGLMDTDGTWNTARNRANFATTTKGLAVAVEELLCTLGQRPHLAEVQRTGYGLTITAYDVEWRPHGMMPFRLPRKIAKAKTGHESIHATRRVIVSVEPGPDVETACIGVDSGNRTYLCGERMIPTHNTGTLNFGVGKMCMQLAVYAHSVPYDPATDERRRYDRPVNQDRGLIIGLSGETGLVELRWVDLVAGWQGVQLATQVRGWRSRSALSRPAGQVIAVPPVEVPAPLAQLPPEAEAALLAAIDRATTTDELVELWRDAQVRGYWTVEHTARAAARKAVLLRAA